MGARQLTVVATLPRVPARRARTLPRLSLRRARARRVVLVGASADVLRLREQLIALDGGDFEIVGHVGTAASRPCIGGARATPPVLGTTRDLARVVRSHRVGEVVVVPAARDGARLLDVVLRATAGIADLRIAIVPGLHELRVGRVATSRLGDVPLIDVTREPPGGAALSVKHVLDHALAVVLLVVSLPLVALAALAVRLTSRGPVLFRQRRIGRDGCEFMIYKLRTMRDDAEGATGPVLARDGDGRVTPVGRFLRRTRIDELPQLLNVLNGTMSLVGPRPERPELADALLRELPGYGERWLVKPGLTGLAQVRGAYHTSPAGKLRHDLAYVHNRSLLLDLRILAATVCTLAARRGV
ncbi:exopolysaccharide biosynthesis polyprenyl glycosylphosphotransferase [Candidatus Binatia bacterium]|nr:exopolysaccharide biosynthesis polyprenyl glycosylphosphotransferase [Candidatus Binatia bacterium]